MDSVELTKIKEYQREFLALYDKKLHIDWMAMKGLPRYERGIIVRSEEDKRPLDPQDLLNECLKKHKADINIIKDRKNRLQFGALHKEKRAVMEYSSLILYNKLNVREAAKLINRDRTCLYHYSGLK
jgi:hypothetical protein